METLNLTNVTENGQRPVDIHVGARIRLRRKRLGLSQAQLAKALGVSHQQMQKNESGENRVGASRIFNLSKLLDVPINFFFDDMPHLLPIENISGIGAPVGCHETTEEGLSIDVMIRQETVELVQCYYKISHASVRKRLLQLFHAFATCGTTSV